MSRPGIIILPNDCAKESYVFAGESLRNLMIKSAGSSVHLETKAAYQRINGAPLDDARDVEIACDLRHKGVSRDTEDFVDFAVVNLVVDGAAVAR